MNQVADLIAGAFLVALMVFFALTIGLLIDRPLSPDASTTEQALYPEESVPDQEVAPLRGMTALNTDG